MFGQLCFSGVTEETMLVLSGPFELAAVWMLKRRLRYKTARLVVGWVEVNPALVDHPPWTNNLGANTKR